MNGAGPTRIEQFNLVVRSLVTIGLTAGFLWGFVIKESIGADIYTTMFATVLGFWFGSKSDQVRAPDGTTVTTSAGANVGDQPTMTIQTPGGATVTTQPKAPAKEVTP